MSETIFIIDDDEAVRDSLRELLLSEDFQVKAYNSAAAFLAETLPLSGCMVIDIRMPEMDGLELQAELNKRNIRMPVIFVTGHGDVPLAVRAMQAGASDFIEKPYDDELLLKSVRRALELNRKQLDALAYANDVSARMENLTAREHDVLRQLVLGHPNKVIAHNLGISPRTVEIYRANLMEKMGAKSLSDLVRAALAVGDTQLDLGKTP